MFAIICHDKPDQTAARAAHRAAHVEYMKGFAPKMILGGPLRDDSGAASVGSLIVIDLPDRAAVEAFMAGDPFAKAGVFESVVIRSFKKVF